MDSTVQIERLAKDDGPAFFQLRRLAIRQGCSGYYPQSELEAWTDPRTDGQLPSPLPEEFYCARTRGTLVASALLDVSTGEVGAMFVLPEYFGRGIGTVMMRHLEAIAMTRALRALSLDATLNAVSFYRTQGFIGEALGVFRSPRGVVLDCVPMTKSLLAF